MRHVIPTGRPIAIATQRAAAYNEWVSKWSRPALAAIGLGLAYGLVFWKVPGLAGPNAVAVVGGLIVTVGAFVIFAFADLKAVARRIAGRFRPS